MRIDDSDKKLKERVRDERERIKQKEDEVTRDSEQSFPASDPPSFNPGTASANDVKKKKR